MRWQEVAIRLGLNVGATLAIACGVSVWLSAPLMLLALAAACELAVRPYGHQSADRLLLSAGALVTVTILLGLLLNFLPWGLTRGTWAVTQLLVGSSIIFWRRDERTVLPARIWSASVAIWGAGLASAFIFVAAGYIAQAGARTWDQKPALALSLISQSRKSFVVQIDATSVTGKYRIEATLNRAARGRHLTAIVSIDAASGARTIQEQVNVSEPGRWTVTLRPENGSYGKRSLVVDVPR